MKVIKKFTLSILYYIYNSLLTNFPGYGIRIFYLRNVLKYSFDSGSTVHMGCFFTGRMLYVGKNSVLNRNGYFDCRSKLEIGNNVSISPEVYIITAGHDPQSSSFSGKNAPVVLEDYVWIGARALILPGVTIGEGAVVGAGSVVTRSVPPYTIYAGNPARKIGERTKNLTYELNWRPFFNTDIM